MKKQQLDVPVTKNSYYTMTIDDLGVNGEGIGKIKGFTLFVPGALPGDEIEVKVITIKRNYGLGELSKIIHPSKSRIVPRCQLSRHCGGCQLLHYDYASQLEFKTKRVKDTLQRIAGLTDTKVLPTIGMDVPYYYRNKVQYSVGIGKTHCVQIGFYAMKSLNIIEAKKCYIQNPVNEQIIEVVREYINNEHLQKYNEKFEQGFLRRLFTRIGYHTKEIMVCLVINGDVLPQEDLLVEKLKKIPNMTSIILNINKQKSNVIWKNKTRLLWGKETITDYIGDIRYRISPLSFYQINPIQTKKLYDKVIEFANLTGNEIVWDVYCGIGTVALYLAKHVKKVSGVEIIPQAIQDAKYNAQLNHIKNTQFFVGKAEEVLPQKYEHEGLQANLVVLDPPRKGCDQAVLDTLLTLQPPKIIYISCDPTTLARDLKILTEDCYEVEVVQPLDMFPQTTHCESICLLKRIQH